MRTQPHFDPIPFSRQDKINNDILMAASSEPDTMISADESRGEFQDAIDPYSYPEGLLPPLRKVLGSKLEELNISQADAMNHSLQYVAMHMNQIRFLTFF